MKLVSLTKMHVIRAFVEGEAASYMRHVANDGTPVWYQATFTGFELVFWEETAIELEELYQANLDKVVVEPGA